MKKRLKYTGGLHIVMMSDLSLNSSFRGGIVMKLEEIKPVIVDKVCLYIELDDNNYQDLWKGIPKNIPKEFLDYKVRVIGAKQKDILDIELVKGE